MPTVRNCKISGKDFYITDRDEDFYNKINVPLPEVSPNERLRRRLLFRNEVNFYKRKSDFSGKEIISIYSPDKPFKVFSYEEWWADNWDGRLFGQNIDFNRSFFEQFKELQKNVPRLSLYLQARNENCSYINYGTWNKSCYLIMAGNSNEDCYYSVFIHDSKNSSDCLFGRWCELCYECIDCERCFKLFFSQSSEQCSDSSFLYDCKSCTNCVGCVGLRHKKYYWLNKQLSEEEFKKKYYDLLSGGKPSIDALRIEWKELLLAHPHLFTHGRQNEHVTGDYIYGSKNSHDCFDVTNIEDCRYCTWLHNSKDCYDHYGWGNSGEKCYECMLVGNNAYNVKFSNNCWNEVSDLEYCELCISCRDCFGCVGLKHCRFCIFNKQYSENEYRDLAAKLKEYMIKTGEYGNFFPPELAPFCYNESCAQDHFPLNKNEALSSGYLWKDEDIVQDNNINNSALKCSSCGKNYLMVQQEVKFYKSLNLPFPEKCFKCRHTERLSLRNPRRLWERQCSVCNKILASTYAPERPEIICCEKCYLKKVY